MSNSDLIHRFIFDGSDIRGEITSLEKSYQDACSHQTLPPAIQNVFGEFLAGAVLLSEVLKFEGILSLQARGEGDVELIMAETNDKGELRGLVKLSESPQKSDEDYKEMSLATLIGNATLSITIDPEKGNRYQGIIPLEAPSLAECLSHYFKQSEQLPTHISLFADTKQCGGLFLQCLPAQLVRDSERREEQWNTITQLGSTISQSELFELEHETILYRLFHEMSCRSFDPKALKFKCSCTEERSANAIRSLGRDDAYALLRERDIINIDCQFCGKPYSFGDKELDALFGSDNGALH